MYVLSICDAIRFQLQAFFLSTLKPKRHKLLQSIDFVLFLLPWQYLPTLYCFYCQTYIIFSSIIFNVFQLPQSSMCGNDIFHDEMWPREVFTFLRFTDSPFDSVSAGHVFTFLRFICFLKRFPNSFFLFSESSSSLPHSSSYLYTHIYRRALSLHRLTALTHTAA